MAIKKCRECGHKVSSSAQTCPSCGVKDPYISPFKGIFILAVIGCATWAAFFNDKSSGKDNASSESTVVQTGGARLKTAAPVSMPPAETRPFSISQICKATIAGMFGRPVSTMKSVETSTTDTYAISYRRASDNQRFSFDCKLSDDHVIWRESKQYSDRWHGIGNVDFNVVFNVNGSSLVITELYGGANDISYKYNLKDFR